MIVRIIVILIPMTTTLAVMTFKPQQDDVVVAKLSPGHSIDRPTVENRIRREVEFAQAVTGFTDRHWMHR